METETIVILDFGSQYTQLIARRIREQSVYTMILPGDSSAKEVQALHPKGLILSGGPRSVSEEALDFDQSLLDLGIPTLGICYGMQLLNYLHGGTVGHHGQGEYGKQAVTIDPSAPIFDSLENKPTTCWMSHQDSITELAPGFAPMGHSAAGIVTAIRHTERPLFGLQFHPEVDHTVDGRTMLSNFLSLCACKKEWSLDNYLEAKKQEIRERVGDGKVISFVSGGVDSTVATYLVCQALGPEKVHALYIDTGMMRRGETEQVKELLGRQEICQLKVVDARDDYLDALAGVTDPEQKREIIGSKFLDLLDREAAALQLDGANTFLCQGTLYTDLIESGHGCGKHADKIKSHHNVTPEVIQKKRAAGLVIEPNAELFKDEVRQLGELMGLPHDALYRHPFPGPGLAIRIIADITEERLETLRHADAIYMDELRKHDLYDQIWQAFAVLVPVKTVGVMGDQRNEGHVIALRAVTSRDGMTADTFDFPHEILSGIASRITNEVPSINRVVYDVTSKPPATIEWE